MQHTVEQILGRLLTDSRFRRTFFTHLDARLRRYRLLEHERESLAKLGEVEPLVELLADRLDPRIVRG